MKSVSDIIGLDKKIIEIVETVLAYNSFTKEDVKMMVKQYTETLAADVYSNMKAIEKFKYRLIEVETKLDNLNTFVRSMGKEKWNL